MWYTFVAMDTKVLTYRAIIRKDGKYYHGFVPSLPGCHTQGATIEETKKNLKEAIEGYLISLQKHNEPIPSEDGYEVTEVIITENLFTGKKVSYA